MTVYHCSICGDVHTSSMPPCPRTHQASYSGALDVLRCAADPAGGPHDHVTAMGTALVWCRRCDRYLGTSDELRRAGVALTPMTA